MKDHYLIFIGEYNKGTVECLEMGFYYLFVYHLRDYSIQNTNSCSYRTTSQMDYYLSMLYQHHFFTSIFRNPEVPLTSH